MYRHLFLILALLSMPGAACAIEGDAHVNVTLDGTASGRVFDGIGAASAGGSSRLLINYPETQRAAILDYLFKPNYGAALQMLKVEIGSDANSTDGAEPSHRRSASDENYGRGYEWWLMTEAKKRNPDIKLAALVWNFPAWVGPPNSQRAADYIVSFIEGAKREHHLTIDDVGIWNETRTDYNFIKILRRTLNAHHLTTRIIADDTVDNWNIVSAMEDDPELRKAIDVISTHYPKYVGGGTETPKWPLAQARSEEWGKPLWASEDGPWNDSWGADGQLSHAYAELLNRNYVQGRMTSTQLWSPVTAYYDRLDLAYSGLMRAMSPWSGHFDVMSPLWVVAHTTQFAKPGWRYIDQASGLLPDGGSYVSLHLNAEYSVVIETLKATRPQTVSFSLTGGLSNEDVHIWRTTRRDAFREVATLTPVKGQYSFVFEPDAVYSLTTTSGQAKGQASSPPDRPFPFPYSDDFESYLVGDTNTRYFVEQNGAFEISTCPLRPGQCLHQVAEKSPVPWLYYGRWGDTGVPSVIGDGNWRNYSVSADVLLEEGGYAMVVGRMDRQSADGAFSAYQFRLYADGRWELLASEKGVPVTKGQIAIRQTSWHHLALIMRGNVLVGEIDGKSVLKQSDDRHLSGLAGLGSGWNKVQFDNFRIGSVADFPLYEVPPPPAFPPQVAPVLLVPLTDTDSYTVRWARVRDADRYRVRIALSETGPFLQDVAVGNQLDHHFDGLKSGVKYYVDVTAGNEAGEGPAAKQLAIPGLP
ncbi:hypothetical protein [Asticcacaulis sp.]|uniref:hypothetical protein n=1 Tax=Asticcacaulis sp. TaxID=1872648 RepID=UPI002C1F0CF3|nr:hypothetical protein [Asticcacaulis sp.]HTM81538.1 hypothetical protein [Asticcacaulis sp.]